MSAAIRAVSAGACSVLLASCSQSPGDISRDAKPFDGIAPSSTITALGTEPFWGLDIAPEGAGGGAVGDGGEAYTARFTSPDDLDGTPFAVTRFAGNNGISFSGELSGEPAQIALTPGECSDGMSDRLYPYTATVAWGEVTLFGCAHTSDEPFTGDETP